MGSYTDLPRSHGGVEKHRVCERGSRFLRVGSKQRHWTRGGDGAGSDGAGGDGAGGDGIGSDGAGSYGELAVMELAITTYHAS